MSFVVSSQVIAPITFSFGSTYFNYGQAGAVAEDSVNNKLYFQVSCSCGPGPGNQWSAMTYADLNNNQYFVPVTFYNPYGNRFVCKEMQYGANGVNLNDGQAYTRFNVPSYTPAWGYTPTASQTVVASAMRNDSVFTLTDDGSFCQILEIRNRNTGALLSFNTIGCPATSKGYIFGEVSVVKLYGSKLYIGGGLWAMDQFSTILDDNITSIDVTNGQIVPLNYAVNDTVKDIEIYNGKVHIAGNFTSVKGQSRSHYASLGLLSGALDSGTPSFNSSIQEIEVYDHFLFAIGRYTTINSTVVNPFGDVILKAVDLSANTVMSWNLPFSVSGNPNDDYLLENSRNRLYTSNRTNGWWTIDAFCLPPIKNSTSISTATTAFCTPSSGNTFSVAPFTYASSYTWLYTGVGASVSNLNNIATVSFAAGATSGKLKVFAQSVCGGVSDTLSINITIYPKPNITASLIDDTLNCFKPKVPLLGNSTSTNVSYSWSGPSGYNSVQQNDSTGYYLPGAYTLSVTSLTTGCKNTASVLVRIDTVKPNVTLPVGPYLVGCGTSSLITLNGTSSTTPTILWWKKNTSATYTINPVSVGLGNYFLEARNTYNGCIKASSLITVSLSAAMPTVSLVSHTYTNAVTPVDTITCTKTSVTLSVACTPTNCSIIWKNIATQTLSANPVTVFGGGNQMPIVTRLDNNCVDSSNIVFVDQNLSAPNILILTQNPNINCSNSTATLNAAFSPTVSIGIWTGPSSFTASNPAVASTQGKYFFTVTRPDNGCSKTDSVNVGYSNLLVVDASNDTSICKNAVATISASVQGTLTGITYTWNSGGSGQVLSVNPAITTTYVVTASSTLGCTGKDTVVVTIPADLQDSIVTSKGCTGNNGSLTIYVKGGLAPYKYSVNGSPFTSQMSYTNLPFATYSVSIKDSIGCILNTSATISQNSNLNQPVFIASTQNFKGDTIVLIDLTVPRADSLGWILPSVASIIGGDMFNPVVVFADTGSFPVTLQAFYGTCMVSTTKLIRISLQDSAYATLTNSNGIKSLNVFPNPNTGQFTVQVEFYKKQNASIQIWDSNPQKHFQQNFSNTDLINLPVNVTQLQNGTFVLRVIGEYASRHFYFVISK